MSLISNLGPWSWMILGIILLGLEIMAPGTFFLWFGMSAIVVGAVSLVVGTGTALWGWEVQLVAFLVLSLMSAIVGRRVMRKRGWDKSDRPNLNEGAAKLVGKTAVLVDPIANGQGRVKIGDTTWRVRGPEAKAGTKVRVVSFDAGTLQVETV